jgi:hypothetical protein
MDKLVNESTRQRQRIVVGISGATGIIYGIRALQMLRETTSPACSMRGWRQPQDRGAAPAGLRSGRETGVKAYITDATHFSPG